MDLMTAKWWTVMELYFFDWHTIRSVRQKVKIVSRQCCISATARRFTWRWLKELQKPHNKQIYTWKCYSRHVQWPLRCVCTNNWNPLWHTWVEQLARIAWKTFTKYRKHEIQERFSKATACLRNKRGYYGHHLRKHSVYLKDRKSFWGKELRCKIVNKRN